MYTGLNHLHSATRYAVLLFIILTVVMAILGVVGKKSFSKSEKMMALLGLIFTHFQITIGLVMYFLSPWFSAMTTDVGSVMANSQSRFFAVEHWLIMIIGAVLITMGYSKAKKADDDMKKHRLLLAFYGIGLLIIFYGIPWPFLRDFGSWF